jgi:IS605 OrfB family transposase
MSRVTDRRTDFCAQTAGHLVSKNALVVLEDLRTRDMSASAAGTLTEPGRNVRAKAGLNRAILDKGWHRLELALTSAARFTGTRVVKINPAYTSQRCHACGRQYRSRGCERGEEHQGGRTSRLSLWRPRHQLVREAGTRKPGNRLKPNIRESTGISAGRKSRTWTRSKKRTCPNLVCSSSTSG